MDRQKATADNAASKRLHPDGGTPRGDAKKVRGQSRTHACMHHLILCSGMQFLAPQGLNSQSVDDVP